MGIDSIRASLGRPVHIAPLVVFRIAFGLLMFGSMLRFMLKGWVDQLYINPKMFFPYFGFEWVKPLPGEWMYLVFGLLLLASLLITFGLLYRFAAISFFLLFTYVELIDKTNYLNHYYFVSVISFLLIFLPAHRYFSLDVRFRPQLARSRVPNYLVLPIKLQLLCVYFFAGVAKLNADWLLEAQPLKIWLPAFNHLPLIGPLVEQEWVAYLFSWFGCVYDLAIGFLLFGRRTVKLAYVLVVIFHLFTALFFNIGMFPWIMITITVIFFPENAHLRMLGFLQGIFGKGKMPVVELCEPRLPFRKLLIGLLAVHFLFQVLLPFRYLVYPGDLFWTEQGYRFSWRVMLMEKAGTAFFYVKDRASGRESEVNNSAYLTFMQEKMLATQPDMMVDYAHFLKKEFERKGVKDPIIRAECYVTLNGRGSRLFIDPQVDLASQTNNPLKVKNWILPYERKN